MKRPLVFIGEPKSGKTVLYLRLRALLTALVARTRIDETDARTDSRVTDSLRLSDWLHRDESQIDFVGWFIRHVQHSDVAHYRESQATSELLRVPQSQLMEGCWPDATTSTQRGWMRVTRAGFFGTLGYEFDVHDYCGEVVARAFPNVTTTQTAPLNAAPAPSTPEADAETLKGQLKDGAIVVFVIDGKELLEGGLPLVTERAVAAILDAREAPFASILARFYCIVTKMDEVNLATSVSPEHSISSPKEYLQRHHASFWNHLKSLEAEYLEVVAVATRISPKGERLPMVAPQIFDRSLVKFATWLFRAVQD